MLRLPACPKGSKNFQKLCNAFSKSQCMIGYSLYVQPAGRFPAIALSVAECFRVGEFCRCTGIQMYKASLLRLLRLFGGVHGTLPDCPSVQQKDS
mmetsp:Transcript_87530/g.237119  ORF Transcript_87530/g.237119 Transcript_87530/m.237119 type:complete len:95 (+) Transcript_87530:123-407(+)